MAINHQNNFATNLTSGISAGATTAPLNSIPSIAADFYLAFDATNINGKYEVVLCTSKTATNVNFAACANDHTTAEEVRMVVPAAELDAWSSYLGRNTVVEMQVYDAATSWSTGDGKGIFICPPAINGYNLTAVYIRAGTAGTTNVSTITLISPQGDMLSTGVSIDSGETGSDTAATPYVIDTAKDNVNSYDYILVNIDAISSTPPKGLWVILEFTKP